MTDPAQGRLTASFTRHVHNYLLIGETRLAPAHLGFVFGNAHATEALAARAADLYHKGYFPLVLVSGGVETAQGGTEAGVIKHHMTRLNVPAHVILCEPTATNSQENVERGRAVLAQAGHLEGIESLIAIGHVAAGRRFLMTMRRHWPDVLAMLAAANPYPVALKDWHTHDSFREKVMEEWRKLTPYRNKGFIEDIDLADINRRVSGMTPSQGLSP